MGAGPGDPGLLTVRGRQRIEEAEVVVYDYLVSEGVRSFIAPGAERLFVGKQAGKCAMVQPEINALLVRLAREGKRVVRLKGGTPFCLDEEGRSVRLWKRRVYPLRLSPGSRPLLPHPPMQESRSPTGGMLLPSPSPRAMEPSVRMVPSIGEACLFTAAHSWY